MESIRQIFRIGHGPSSSHTMGPMRAAQMFLDKNPGASRFEVTLYGSLAATGKGHMTDKAILDVLTPKAPTNIIWKPKVFLSFHPNGLLFEAWDDQENKLDSWTIYSIGGGTLANETYNEQTATQVYDMNHIHDIQAWCERTGYSYWEYVEQCEGKEIWDYLAEVWERAGSRRYPAGRIGNPAKGLRLYDSRTRVWKQHQEPRIGLCVRAGCIRRKCLRRKNRDSSDMRFLRGYTGCALPPERDTGVPRFAHPPCTGYGRAIRECSPHKRLHIRSRSRMPGGSRCGLLYGRGRRQPTVRRDSRPNRICRRNGTGTSLRTDL